MSGAASAEEVRLAFRDAMSRMGAGVNIITSNGPAGRCGITMTAVCSVSDTPPTMLVCLNRTSAMNQVIKDNGVLCINLLSAEQEEQARHFAGMTGRPMAQRFADPAWEEDASGLPRLAGALANMQGRIARAEEVGSHTILIVELTRIDVRGERGPGLVYFDRLFHGIPGQAAAIAQD